MRRMYSKSQIEKIAEQGGKVRSVNSKTGEVVLNATDIKLTTTGTTVQDNFIRIDTDMDGKVDKITTTGDVRAYIINSDGTQATAKVSSGASGGTLARRSSSGTLATASPTADNHAVTLRYLNEHASKAPITVAVGSQLDVYWSEISGLSVDNDYLVTCCSNSGCATFVWKSGQAYGVTTYWSLESDYLVNMTGAAGYAVFQQI